MSTVIKAGREGAVLRGLARVDLTDHAAEARRIIDHARRRAAEILTRARRDRDRLLTEIRETAYESGYGAGRDEGAAAGREAAHREAAERFAEAQAHLVADLIRVVDEVDGMKRDLRIAAEKDLLEFALRLAEKLTLAIGRVNRESAVVNLGRALELIHGKGRLVVRAHPDDAATLAAFAESVRTRLHESSEIRLVSDESIAPGGCVVRAETTEVDARLETQLAELVSLLLAERSGHD